MTPLAWGVALLVLLAAGIAVCLRWDQASPPPEVTDFQTLIAAMRSGSAHHSQEAIVNDHWDVAEANLSLLLTHDDPLVRAAACALLERRGDRQWLWAIPPRASDTDWRVRAAAYSALQSLGSHAGPLPFRDTPMAQRESQLLAWLDQVDSDNGAPVSRELCELYADARHTELAQPMVARCLVCHAGAASRPTSAVDDCKTCHQSTHTQWISSAHAQSLSHLKLRTVDAETRQPAWFDFGDIAGITCLECHRAVGAPADSEVVAADDGQCRYTFDSQAPAAESCIRCHHHTARQWQAWMSGDKPRQATWPPGALESSPADAKHTCVDCHMSVVADESANAWADHRWLTRRDADMLRRGLHMQVDPPKPPAAGDSAHVVAIVLTNTSGHGFPTGTRRRAVQIVAEFDSGSTIIVSQLVPQRLGEVDLQVDAALTPGEQRRITFVAPAGSTRVQLRVIYVRNRFDADSPVVDLLGRDIAIQP